MIDRSPLLGVLPTKKFETVDVIGDGDKAYAFGPLVYGFFETHNKNHWKVRQPGSSTCRLYHTNKDGK